MNPIQRIHHISATVSDVNENVTFYRDILGLRLVKKTINFEDSGTYHLYFANQNADEGTIMTFFPLSNNLHGRVGSGQVRRIAFAVPKGTLNLWRNHLTKNEIYYIEDNTFRAAGLYITAPDNLSITLIETDVKTDNHNIIGFYGVELLSEKPEHTLKLLLNDMGLQLIKVEDYYYHLAMVGKEEHKVLINRQITKRGRFGIGTVHHIAWSVPDLVTLEKHKEILEQTNQVTDIKNRKYFNSFYFKEPGKIIYEFSTRGPGFTVDEPFEQLGTGLMLPQKYEEQRDAIENLLPKIL